MASHKPPPPAADGSQFTATITLQAPTGTPLPNVFYVFNTSSLGHGGTSTSIGVPPNHNAAIFGVNISLTVLALIIVILRIFSRFKFSKVWWDDFCVGLSVVCSIVLSKT